MAVSVRRTAVLCLLFLIIQTKYGWGRQYPSSSNSSKSSSRRNLKSSTNDAQWSTHLHQQQLSSRRTNSKLSPGNTSGSKYVFERLLCCSAGFAGVRSLRTVGTTLMFATGGTLRTVLLATEGRWKEARLPAVVVMSYSMGALLARVLQRVAAFQWRQRRLMIHDMSSEVVLEPSNIGSAVDPSIPILGFHVSFSGTKNSLLAVTVIPFIFGLFLLAQYLNGVNEALLCTGTQSLAYGLIHTSAQELCGGTVLFALTGHYSSSMKTTVDWIMGGKRVGRQLMERVSMIGSFVIGVVCSVLFWDYVIPRCPFQFTKEHICSGIWYSSLFFWFSWTLKA